MAETDKTPKKGSPPKNWQTVFFSALRENGNIADACRRAKVSRATVYRYCDTSARFKAEWDAALEEAVEELERIANWRARMTSDTLMIFLLKAHRPDKYREVSRHELTGKDGAPLNQPKVIVYLPDNGRDNNSAATGAARSVPGQRS